MHSEAPHFAIIADETASHGREILSVCLRFIDTVSDPASPIKREALIDMYELPQTTGMAIATAIKESLQKQSIPLSNCRGQAYDTTASMSSNQEDVHAEIVKDAPDAEYQGCCLHSINLVICHASEIKAIKNMMDSCHELFAFFDNSPKRQKFLKIVINAFSSQSAKKKLKDLCMTRLVARHTAFKTIFDLYKYIVKALNEICQPTYNESIYPNEEEWSWDSKTKTMANGLRHTTVDFGFIVSFMSAKELLEPMKPLVSALQGLHVEVYFWVQENRRGQFGIC